MGPLFQHMVHCREALALDPLTPYMFRHQCSACKNLCVISGRLMGLLTIFVAFTDFSVQAAFSQMNRKWLWLLRDLETSLAHNASLDEPSERTTRSNICADYFSIRSCLPGMTCTSSFYDYNNNHLN